MAFLTDNDYKILISTEDLDIVQSSDTELRTSAELIAQDEISAYINTTIYDASQTFAATGTDRNNTIIKMMIDITLYQLFSGIPGNQLTEIRVERYDKAIKDLEKLQKGMVDIGLPIYPVEDEITTGQLKWGSRAKLRQGR